MARNVVQYSNPEDFEAADALAKFFGFELINVQDIFWQSFGKLIVVGAQNGNPVFKYLVDSGTMSSARYVNESDQGYVFIQYQKVYFGLGSTEYWLVAGYNASDTLKSAQFLISEGIYPDGGPRKAGTRKLLNPDGTIPPPDVPPPASHVTSGITMTMVAEALKAGVIPYVVSIGVAVGGSIIDNDKIKKLLYVTALASAGAGVYFSYDYLHKQGVV